MKYRANMRIYGTSLRILAFLLVVTGIIFVSSDSFASVRAVEETPNEPVWENPGSIKLNKTATPVQGSDNLWKIDLSIDGKDYRTTTDIVLVIDTSNSMGWSMSGNSSVNPSKSRLNYTKTAAKAFVKNILERNINNENRIAIVKFGTDSKKVSDFSSDINLLNRKIDELDLSGGTNMQAGLCKAYELISNSKAENKSVVMLGDGKPTHMYKIKSVDGFTVKHISNSEHKIEYDINKITMTFDNSITVNLDYNSVYIFNCNQKGCKKRVRLNDNTLPAEYEAAVIKKNGINIYSIAFGADSTGVKTLKNISNTGSGVFFTEIPASTTESSIQTLLNGTFESIAASISGAAKDGYVTDPMGDMFDLVSEASEISVSQGTVELSSDKRKIKWNVGAVKEGTKATMSYIVRIKDEAESEKNYPTNGETVFYYKNYLGKDTIKKFPIPEAGIAYGTINVVCYLSDSDGKPLGNDGQAVDSVKNARILKEYLYTINGNSKIPLEKNCTVISPSIDNTSFIGSYTDGSAISSDKSVSVKLTSSNSKRTVYFAYSMINGKLTVVKTGDLLDDESAIFKIEGSDGSTSFVTIQGTGSKTFNNLTIGVKYTVTEMTDWSWKYELKDKNSQTVCIMPDTDNTVGFENRGNTRWLTDESYAENIFNAV